VQLGRSVAEVTLAAEFGPLFRVDVNYLHLAAEFRRIISVVFELYFRVQFLKEREREKILGTRKKNKIMMFFTSCHGNLYAAFVLNAIFHVSISNLEMSFLFVRR
jgi:hypothetical protein